MGEGGPSDVGESDPGEPDALAIVGPTATGKTEVAVEVARRLDGEVISMDSRQVYRGLAVGTGAPSPAETAAVPHHGVAMLDPRERYSAGRFSRLARRWIREIRRRGRVPILEGGTGFFLEALVDPVFREPPMDPGRRRRLKAWCRAQPADRLAAWARRLDPELAERRESVDPQRAARTLELAFLSGRPLTWWWEHGEPEAAALRIRCWRLGLPREEHRARIRKRVERQLEEGWMEEARRLLDAGLEEAPAVTAVGYPEVFALLRGDVDREEAVERIVRDTWRYARRQRTWFRGRLPAGTPRLDAREPAGQLARRIVEEWRAAASSRPSRAETRSADAEGKGGDA